MPAFSNFKSRTRLNCFCFVIRTASLDELLLLWKPAKLLHMKIALLEMSKLASKRDEDDDDVKKTKPTV
jgi:hypothetical protein